MDRTFETRTTEFGSDVVDDQGTRWAAFDRGDADAEALAGRFLDLARQSYGIGALDAGAREARFSCRRGRSASGAPTWDIVHPGRNGPVAAEPRSRLDIQPSRTARSMLSLANGLYEVALSDHARGAAPAPCL